MKLALQIAAGIVMAAIVVFVFRMLLVVASVKAVGHAAQQMQATVQQQAADMQARVLAQQAERLRQAEEAKRAQLEANAAQMRAAAYAARVEQEAATKKVTAWAAFYRPAKKCDNPGDWDTQVECGNAHIRAQREFEARWEQRETQLR